MSVEPNPNQPVSQQAGQQVVVVVQERKSLIAAILLAFFFNSLGLLYASITGGIILTIVNAVFLIIAFITLGLGSILFGITWVISIIWAVVAVNSYNDKVAAKFNTQ